MCAKYNFKLEQPKIFLSIMLTECSSLKFKYSDFDSKLCVSCKRNHRYKTLSPNGTHTLHYRHIKLVKLLKL